MIELTDEAIQQIISLQAEDPNLSHIRVGVTGGGCAGYEYVFKSDVPNDGDTIIDLGKFSIIVDKPSVPFVEGMTLDYVKEGLNSFFKFINPKEQATCGCGVSVQFYNF